MNITSYVIIMALLLLASAYFSATETAFTSFNKTKMKSLAEKGNKRAALAYSLSENYDKLLTTILIGNNIVNISLTSIGTLLFINLLQSDSAAASVSTIVITLLVLTFGEISPKSIAKNSPEKFSMFSAPLLRVLVYIFTPLNFLFTQLTKLLAKIFKSDDSSKISSEELLLIVDEVEQDGTLDSDESDLIKNAIEFTEQEAEDILTHRVDLEAVSIQASKAEIAKTFTSTQFSRLLVYNENIDDIVGVIHLKDFFTENGITNQSIKSIMTKPLFIQKSEKLNDLLKILQKNKSHLAVVIDEYGGTLGIVTMEDILEELVGEIWDEHDEVIEDFKQIGDKTFLVDASVNFEDFCDFFDITAETDSVSVGGWVMEEYGQIPEKGDSFTFENLDITVTETDSHRITKIKVLVSEKQEDEDEN